MKEYKVIYEDGGVASHLEKMINDLAREGWVVKFSNITALPQSKNLASIGVCFYALLERDIPERDILP